jgi:large subunit ribosomal protein L3
VNGLIGRKVGMTQVFSEQGLSLPVTVIEIQPNRVVQVKTVERDGYAAVQLGATASKKLNKALMGHLGNNGALKTLREFPIDGETPEVGAEVDVSIFAKGEMVDVVGTSKGKGFAGVVKRHHFAGGPRTHGQSDRHRAPGSVGASSTPGRVFKGMRMAGHLGDSKTTVQNLEVIEADPERKLLLVKGAVPGARNGTVIVRRAVKNPGKRG